MTASVAVSAPGKVLLAGGYLVLDRQYSGLVFGLSARINVIVEPIETMQGVQIREIVVESPQFVDAVWHFGWHLAGEDGGIVVTQLQTDGKMSRNPFVETALTYALTFINAVSPDAALHGLKPAKLKILADNDYYSTQSLSAEEASRRFSHFGTPISGANKTGLGSSAALVTSLTAALLVHYLGYTLQSHEEKLVLHNLAQASHCAAQGKIGSGFDVAAAVFGSCKYRRFSPATLDASAVPEPGTAGFAGKLKSLVLGQWDVQIDKNVALPPGIALRMFDVACGTQTVSMVKGVLKWRAGDAAGSKKLWDELHAQNEALADVLSSGDKTGIPTAVAAIRASIRDMTQRTGMPIEPDTQTKLLDAISQVDGVYGGVVPGAGGYDAISVLAEESAVQRLEEFEEQWNKTEAEKTRLLRVKGEMEGVKVEELSKFEGWI
ncbi:hypothetical protein TD95_003131 [Thielaviopsis punctulata]|uniref:Phosphomevalonate kinase n=1 Tax=Thielaviopsis punctulata TaxID=72032 RepID=A0A0F4Z8B0_9PEZI|nr:hypothetical protein TD95_003131 [Thielaviopsis punctulata]